jgi:hypothetical protein
LNIVLLDAIIGIVGDPDPRSRFHLEENLNKEKIEVKSVKKYKWGKRKGEKE